MIKLHNLARRVPLWAWGLLCLAVLGGAMRHASAQVTDARTQLQQFVASVSSASGVFRQTPESASQAPQSGVFSFQRPGKFRWEVQQPYAQLVLSDGAHVFQYDPDLDQVTQRPLTTAMGGSPAAILFGQGTFEQAFTLSDLPDAEGWAWLRAQPRETDAGFVHVDIAFQNGLPTCLRVLDAFGQVTRIDLRNLQPHPALAPETFQFQVPDGVDVVQLP